MQPINMIMIYYWENKLKNKLQILEADNYKFLKKLIWCL